MATQKISLGRQTNLDAVSQKIVNVLDPTNPQDVATMAWVQSTFGSVDAVLFKGVIDASANPNYPAADAGHLYRISVAGKIGGASGVNVEAGDTILCLVDGSVAGNQATVGANWNISQANIDGAVIGPASATNNAIALFDGTTGKLIKDSVVAISTDGTFAANSDAKVPTEKAVKTYIASLGGLANANFVVRETPSGSVNGSNTAFVLANTPVVGSEEVYLNGLMQEPGAGNDYTISGATITYLTAPISGDKIRVSYRK